MSAPTPYDEHDYDDFDDDELEPRRRRPSAVVKTVATVAAAGVLAFGATSALSKQSTSNANPAAAASAGQTAGAYGGRGGFGTPVTGGTLTKLKSVVTAKYAGASVEQAMKLQDGSYEVHVIQSSGTEVHALVSKDFEITGTQQGGPGRGMGTPVSGAALTRLKSAVSAKYAGASVERADTLPDGSYEVHVIQTNGTEVHVLVSKDFKITGTEQGGGPGGSPPAGQTAPSTGTQS